MSTDEVINLIEFGRMSLDDRNVADMKHEIDEWLKDNLPCVFHSSEKVSWKTTIDNSIENDPRNPLYDNNKRKEVRFDLQALQRFHKLKRLEEEERHMKANPMLYTKRDFARHRLQKKILSRSDSFSY